MLDRLVMRDGLGELNTLVRIVPGIVQSRLRNADGNCSDLEFFDIEAGSRAELVGDIARILDEAITNIDDVSSRDEKNPLVPKALRKLATEATRIINQLKPFSSQAKGDAEVASFEQLLENAESIVAAANKLPPPVEKKKDKSKNSKTGK